MVQNLFDLTGKVALITGGNSGLGLGFARGLAKSGADVVIWGRSKAKNAAVAEEFAAYGNRVLTAEVDVADEAAVVAAMADAVARFGRLDCVIANAGIASPVPSVLELDSKTYHDLLNINQHGGFFTLREGARHMVERAKAGDPGGSLIVCGSLSVFCGVPGMAHYGAAKGALAAIMKSMAVDLGRYGIRANIVAPGYIRTELGRDGDTEVQRATENAFAARTPIPPIGYPEDFEGIAAYLASDRASFHSGDIIVIDGGYLASI